MTTPSPQVTAATRILALETSGFSGSIALAMGDTLVTQAALPPRQRTAQGLAPLIEQQLQAAGWRPADLQLIAVTQGPGSFTGLRVGIVTAKTLAYATGAAVLGVDTMKVLAHSVEAPNKTPRLSVVLDAQRNQLFVEDFVPDENGHWRVDQATRIVDNDVWLASLTAETKVTGTGLTKLKARIPATTTVVSETLWEPTATAVAALAWREFLGGRRDDLWTIAPNYFRPSAAEEKFPV